MKFDGLTPGAKRRYGTLKIWDQKERIRVRERNLPGSIPVGQFALVVFSSAAGVYSLFWVVSQSLAFHL
ncbi:MAG: hypothetical protein JKX97_04095 [Candidatus Lindowbacteria bacterium]|nr:hypothetical protein [Candidatus Lindowbacteria bacterium]